MESLITISLLLGLLKALRELRLHHLIAGRGDLFVERFALPLVVDDLALGICRRKIRNPRPGHSGHPRKIDRFVASICYNKVELLFNTLELRLAMPTVAGFAHLTADWTLTGPRATCAVLDLHRKD